MFTLFLYILREARAFRRRLEERHPGYARVNWWWRRGVLGVIVVSALAAMNNTLGSALFYALVLAVVIYVFWRRKNSAGTAGVGVQGVAKVVAEPHDLARIYHPAHTALPRRGWQVGMPIAIGRELGIIEGRAWFPHAVVLGATGSGKTTLLRRFLNRWLLGGPATVMSTKADIVPPPAGEPGVVHVVTPQGRAYLDVDGAERLQALEAAGWKVIDCRWDPAHWVAEAADISGVQRRAATIARCLSEVVGHGETARDFWTEASSDLIKAGLIIEAATLNAGLASWVELLDPQPAGSRAGSDRLLTQATSTGQPGAERLVAELQLKNLTDLTKQCSELPLTLSPTVRAAAGEVLETAGLLEANNVTALSRYQTMAIALGAYKYPDESGRPTLNVGAWANSLHDLLVVIVPSSESKSWAAPMAALAVALWSDASTNSGDQLILLDEMASLAPVPGIAEWTAQGRSLGLHVVGVLQGEGQAHIWSRDTAEWILNTWPVALVAAGTPAYGLAKHLADGEGQHEVAKQSRTQRPDRSTFFGGMQDDGTTTSFEMRDRIEPNHVFDEASLGAWRVIDRRVGPWAEGI